MFKNFFFGTLLTVTSAGIGASVAFMLALPLVCATGELLFDALLYIIPVSGGVAGVGVAWWVLLRKPGDLKHAMHPNQCLNCGYDLRGNESGRCPECNAGISREQLRYIRLK